MKALPAIGDTITIGGEAVQILAMKESGYSLILLGTWREPRPFATWLYDPTNGAAFSGRYWQRRDIAETDFRDRF